MSSLPRIYLPAPSTFLRVPSAPSRLPPAASPAYLLFIPLVFLLTALLFWGSQQAVQREAVVEHQSRVLVILSDSLSQEQDTATQALLLAHEKTLSERMTWHDAFVAREAAMSGWRSALAARIGGDYKLAPQAARFLVKEGQQAAEAHHIDPVLLMAVVAVESRFNPYAISSSGAVGLTQTMPSAHPAKVQAINARGSSLVDPSSNLHVGAEILSECMHRGRGNTVFALQCYNGSGNDATAKYAHKVLNVYDRLKGHLPALPKGPTTPYPPADIQLALASVSGANRG